MDPALTVDEASKVLRCSERTVWNLIAAGTLRRARSHGKATLVFSSDVLAALEPETPKRRAKRKAIPSVAGFELDDIPL